MQWINSASIHSGEYFHGPFEITETGTPFILLKSSGRTRPLDDRAIRFIERYQGKLQIIDVEKVGIDALHASVREYFCGLLHNCVLDVYNLALATARNHPLPASPGVILRGCVEDYQLKSSIRNSKIS